MGPFKEDAPEPAPKGDHAPPKNRRRIRRPKAERRRQIAEATYQLLGQHGIQGTTVAQIAKAVGMSAPSLYGHFGSRYEILVAAMDPVYERVAQWLGLSKKQNVPERLREMGEAHSEFMMSEIGFVIPVFEYVLAPRDTDLASRFGRRQLKVIQKIAETVAEGQRQGTVRADLDPMQTAWGIMIFAWSEDIAHLMGLEEYVTKGYSGYVLDLLIRDMLPREQQ